MPYDRGRWGAKSCTAGTGLCVYALWMPRDGGKLQDQMVGVPKIDQRTFQQLQVVDILAAGEVKQVPQERVQQWVDCMEVMHCELESERISDRTVEQTDVLFVSHIRQTIELADIPVLQVVEETFFSQDRVPQRLVEGASASWDCKVQGHDRIRIRSVFWGQGFFQNRVQQLFVEQVKEVPFLCRR